ncbi:MAG: 4Fe-4S binding protein, partial [Singulisphaera sp.]
MSFGKGLLSATGHAPAVPARSSSGRADAPAAGAGIKSRLLAGSRTADGPQDSKTEGLFTVEYPDERLPVYERFRVLPVLIYDADDGNVRCTSCNICAKVCPPQCIWMTHAKAPDGKPVPLPEDFYIDMDVCMNCGLCAEYCPFDAIKMDQNF